MKGFAHWLMMALERRFGLPWGWTKPTLYQDRFTVSVERIGYEFSEEPSPCDQYAVIRPERMVQ